MSGAELPSRPRLAEHAMARRHFIDGEEVVVVHDARSGDLVRMPPRAWALVEAADGTRDLGGLLLAASQKGELRRASEVTAVLTDLHAAGLLTDGIDPFAFAGGPAVDAGAPLDVLSFTLMCDGSGSCCATYGTVRFTEEEAARARSTLPHVEGGRARSFLPLAGSGVQPSCAVTMIDGRCGYLAGDGACEIHRRHGAAAKPAGCAIYPATFAYDGEAVRVSLVVECACVAKSLGKKDGAPLVSEGAASRADLPAGVQIAVLPEAIEIRPGVTAPRADVVRWSRAVVGALAGAGAGAASGVAALGDAVATLWALAAKVDADNLSDAAVLQAMDQARAAPLGKDAPAPGGNAPWSEAISPWIEALSARAAAKRGSADRWRSALDQVRAASGILAEGAAALRREDVLAAVLAGEGAARELEAFYVTAAVHGHALLGEVPLSSALRDRATRLLLARAVARGRNTNADARTVLTLVEAMMRAQGLKEYAREVPIPPAPAG